MNNISDGGVEWCRKPFRFRNNRCQGHHIDEVSSFQSRHVDNELVREALYPWSHPMRCWAIAGWGPVPASLRAPEGIYRELELINPSDLDQEIGCTLGHFWYEKYHHQNIIFWDDGTCEIKVGEMRWVAIIDVRDDTTIKNMEVAPEGRAAIVCPEHEIEAFPPLVDKATGREYMEMTSGEFLVRDVQDDVSRLVARVGNAAVGKWFWEHYPRRDDSSMSQLVVWHESVDNTDEYKTPHQGADNDVIKMCYSPTYPCDPRDFTRFVKQHKMVLPVVETFLRNADAEPQLKHAMAKFMTTDPNGLWWKTGELPDGFLLSGFNEDSLWGIFAGELRCEKLCFLRMVSNALFFLPLRSARGIMGGCLKRNEGPDDKLLSIQFKPSRATGKIVAMRAVFRGKCLRR